MPALVLLFLLAAPPAHPWPHGVSNKALSSIPVPPGFSRVEQPASSMGAWLRSLPLKDSNTVHLFNGTPKRNQAAQAAVLDLDSGSKDLQQCADAVMRLRAEFLRSAGREDQVCFRFTSGHAAAWKEWKAGGRPKVKGSKVQWAKTAPPDASYEQFRKYLDTVFQFAGSASLSKELHPRDAGVEPGDVFIQGGHPGHAVMVVDVAVDPGGRRIFLLAQSYMPAQDIHVLKNPQDADLSPWFALPEGDLDTPEWRFPDAHPMRFSDASCAAGDPHR